MKILVTGGAGFIGSHMVKALLERGDTVTIIDNFNDLLYPSSLKEERLEKFIGENDKLGVVHGDINDENVLKEAFSGEPVDVVLHLAALANPKTSLNAEEEYTHANVNGTLAVLKAATANKVRKLVFAGSSSVYNDGQTPFNENSYPLFPRSPYGASKAAAEIYCSMWHDLHGLPITVLRFFSVYGPWGRPDMAPMIFASNLLTDKPIELNRDERKRDLTYIGDVVPAILAAVDTDLGFEVINVGRGEPINIKDLVGALEKASGVEAVIKERETPAGEMRVTYADISKARKLLDYAPTVSVGEGAEKLIEWLRDWLPTQQNN